MKFLQSKEGKQQLSSGGYIFVSHSRKDILIARSIRNRLEAAGFEPLCFFLKCLSDDSEIEDLIKREIDAREWFIFLNSPNAQKSRWVQMERSYIQSNSHSKIITIDIRNERSIENAITYLLHTLQIFLSYAHSDYDLALRIHRQLAERDYRVFSEITELLPQNISLSERLNDLLQEAALGGAVVVLLSEKSVHTNLIHHELELISRKKGLVFAVLIGPVSIPDHLQPYLQNAPAYQLSLHPTDSEIASLTDQIGTYIVNNQPR